MHISVYAICKNESAFVDRFFKAIGEADSVVVLDTGSTDDTVEKLKKWTPNVYSGCVSPWRFDDARNASLALVPKEADVCVCLDLDEELQPGWRQGIEEAWTPTTTRLRYPFIWNWREDGSPGITYYADKIHTRHGGRWRMPCHETLHFRTPEVQTWTEKVKIHHYADNSKPRSNYLPLLELSVAENPDCDRTRHYYARELYFHRRYKEAAVQFMHHLTMPQAKWNAEKSRSFAYLSECEPEKAETHLLQGVALTPDQREPWYYLAKYYRTTGQKDGIMFACTRALAVPEGNKFYLSIPECYDGTLDNWLQEAKAL